jgi:hypothetical protein
MRNLGEVGFVREEKMGKWGSERRAGGGGAMVVVMTGVGRGEKVVGFGGLRV